MIMQKLTNRHSRFLSMIQLPIDSLQLIKHTGCNVLKKANSQYFQIRDAPITSR